MKRGRFTEEQIIGVLREQEAGMKVPELCRKHGISQPTFYAWKAKFGGMSVSDAKSAAGRSTAALVVQRHPELTPWRQQELTPSDVSLFD